MQADIEILKQALDKEDLDVIMEHEHTIRSKKLGELGFNDKVYINVDN